MTAASRSRRPSRYEFSTVRLRFESGGEECVGRLYRPDRPREAPVVVMAPGLAARRAFGLPAIAQRFAARGYAAFAFDYRGFGESDGEPRRLVDPSGQVADLRAAVACARRQDGVDRGRVALWGASLSGGHVLRVAAADAGVSAAVARTPIADGRAFLRRNGLGYLLKGVGLGVADGLLSLAGRSKTVPAVGDESEFALVNAPGARAAVRDLRPRDAARENETPARAFLSLLRYRPVGDAGDVTCPTLLTAGDRDELAPADAVESVADDVPESTFVRLPAGHFDGFDGRGLDRAVGHELAFLDAELGGD